MTGKTEVDREKRFTSGLPTNRPESIESAARLLRRL
jgi:hypothetical protein